MSTPLFSDDEVRDQVNRISSVDVLAESHKKLLKHLVDLALDPNADAGLFTGDALSFDVFKVTSKDSPMGKVIGKQLRERLIKYYDSFGSADLILISLPSKTFKPLIRANSHRFPVLEYPAKEHYESALVDMSIGTLPALTNACKHLSTGLALAPRHPLLTTKFLLAQWELSCRGYTTSLTLTHLNRCLEECLEQRIASADLLFVEACLGAMTTWNWKGALEKAKHANQRSGGRIRTYPFYQTILLASGELDEALDILRHQMHSASGSFYVLTQTLIDMARIYAYMGDCRNAESLYRHILEFDAAIDNYLNLAIHYATWGQSPDRAREVIEKELPSEIVHRPEAKESLLIVKVILGDVDSKDRFEARLEAEHPLVWGPEPQPNIFCDDVSPRMMAFALRSILIGRHDDGVIALERAIVEERHPSAVLWPPYMAFYAGWLRDHVGFQRLLKRINLPASC